MLYKSLRADQTTENILRREREREKEDQTIGTKRYLDLQEAAAVCIWAFLMTSEGGRGKTG